MSTLLALEHRFTPTAQQLSNSANLTGCWICLRANHAHDEPELVAWP